MPPYRRTSTPQSYRVCEFTQAAQKVAPLAPVATRPFSAPRPLSPCWLSPTLWFKTDLKYIYISSIAVCIRYNRYKTQRLILFISTLLIALFSHVLWGLEITRLSLAFLSWFYLGGWGRWEIFAPTYIHVVPFYHCRPRSHHPACRPHLMQRCRYPFSHARTFSSSCVMSQVSFKRPHFLHVTRNCRWLSAAQRTEHRFLTSLSCNQPSFLVSLLISHQGWVSPSLIPWTPNSFPALFVLSILALAYNKFPFFPAFPKPCPLLRVRGRSRSHICLAQMQASLASWMPIAITVFALSSRGFVGLHKYGKCAPGWWAFQVGLYPPQSAANNAWKLLSHYCTFSPSHALSPWTLPKSISEVDSGSSFIVRMKQVITLQS